eukprot:CAMPEP_0204479842 /NCGR_PEP_ID=MMETSP0471-20130131/38421_1 /ASSEMBLY_ACC=CAM_ASM_000602 /TAXON_ID=2969 /ORGANISM="Oxyrrhis marina" /LENGTH=51 /DNA_ID=CAMNT_0051482827 /DNA_START=85 /DNA_END=237 /DNA_ORIENTATION=+
MFEILIAPASRKSSIHPRADRTEPPRRPICGATEAAASRLSAVTPTAQGAR